MVKASRRRAFLDAGILGVDADEREALDLPDAVLHIGQLLDQGADHGADGLVGEQGHQLVDAGLGHLIASLAALSTSAMNASGQSLHRSSSTLSPSSRHTSE